MYDNYKLFGNWMLTIVQFSCFRWIPPSRFWALEVYSHWIWGLCAKYLGVWSLSKSQLEMFELFTYNTGVSLLLTFLHWALLRTLLLNQRSFISFWQLCYMIWIAIFHKKISLAICMVISIFIINASFRSVKLYLKKYIWKRLSYALVYS